jgi:SAM-dependent methyltransferase
MPFEWIDIEALPRLEKDQSVVLFGAGNGSRDLLRFFEEQGAKIRVLAVLDNDPSLQGRSFQGLPVRAPASLPDLGADVVIVTTVSGREAVSAQLEGMGLSKGRDFHLVGTFPSSRATDNLSFLLQRLRNHGLATGGRMLHVGPGGYLGLECGLLALLETPPPSHILAVDAYDFSMRWPEISAALPSYRAMRADVLALAQERGQALPAVADRWDALFQTEAGRTLLDGKRLELRFPHRFSALPVADSSIGLACSFAVLEHVRSPQAAVDELWRVLAPGGATVLTIITRDHRSFGTDQGFSPIAYRAHSADEWERINRDRFYQNRLAPFQWRELFEARGFRLDEYRVQHRYDAPASELAALHPDFRHWPPERQGEVDCSIVAVKP